MMTFSEQFAVLIEQGRCAVDAQYKNKQIVKALTGPQSDDFLGILLTIKYPENGKPLRLKRDLVDVMLALGLLDRDAQGVFITPLVEDILENWLSSLPTDIREKFMNPRLITEADMQKVKQDNHG